jgi:hypothetical protein
MHEHALHTNFRQKQGKEIPEGKEKNVAGAMVMGQGPINPT